MASSTPSSAQTLPDLDRAFAVYLDATNLYPGLNTVYSTALGWADSRSGQPLGP